MGSMFITFTDQTEQDIRMAIAGQKKGGISQFVEEAVREKLEREKKK